MAAFISILSGLIGGVEISSILLRALVVTVIFSIFAALVNIVADTFLNNSTNVTNNTVNEKPDMEGSNVNIVLTEDDDAISELSPVSDNIQSEELSSQLPEDGDERHSQAGKSSHRGQGIGSSFDIDTLPDLGSFSTTFKSTEGTEEKLPDSDEESGYNKSASISSGSQFSAEGLAGTIAEQNSPEDLAKAVKTLLNKEETG